MGPIKNEWGSMSRLTAIMLIALFLTLAYKAFGFIGLILLLLTSPLWIVGLVIFALLSFGLLSIVMFALICYMVNHV